MKNMSVKKWVAIGCGAVVLILVIAFAAVMMLRVDAVEAQEIALSAARGGEIVGREVSSEGLWNEYTYVIENNGSWYEVEISGFGNVTELQQANSQAAFY